MRDRRGLFKGFLCLIISMIVIFSSLSLQEAIAISYDIAKMAETDSIDYNAIDSMVNKMLKNSGIKGASIVIVSGNKTEYRSYGYADEKNGTKVDNTTLFELGSNSKAFTALGILLLEKKGFLSLKDPVKKYIPWFSTEYRGYFDGKYFKSNVELTIENLLYHTSGIPFKTLGSIPEGETEDMLEKTVRTLEGIKLDFYPGSKYSYTTINYDVLGLIIQNISGISYEKYMKENILSPLGLNDTYLSSQEAKDTGRIAKGYKNIFLSPKEYTAPIYRGNTPAAYFISSASDMERWLKIQMGLLEVPEIYKEIIQKSHFGNVTVVPTNSFYYGGGWEINIKGDEIKHEGSNPNFSSMAIIRPNQKLGIYVLCNLNTGAVNYIASNILNIIEGKDVSKYKTDIYKSLDTSFSLITIGSILLSALYLFLLIIALFEIITRRRKRIKLNGAKIAGILLAVPIMIFFGFCVYYLPNVVFYRLTWNAVIVWASPFIKWGCLLGFVAGGIFLVYIVITFNYPKDNERGYMALVPLSIINGLVSALVIFTINESFNRNLEYSKELLIYFIFSVIFTYYSLQILESKLILITNEIVYEKRVNIIMKILDSSFQTIEKIGSSRIYSVLNNDTAAISRMPGILVRLVTDTLTLVFCLVFLLTKNVYAFSVDSRILNGARTEPPKIGARSFD